MKKYSNSVLMLGLICLSLFLSSCGGANYSESDSIKIFDGITFADSSFEYDGNYHSIYCDNVPDFATVSYSGNDKKDVGVYTVYAFVSADNYNDLTLSATLTIFDNKADFSNITFVDQAYEYDGEYHSIYVKGAPDFATITYKNNNQKDIGRYLVTATIEAENYHTKVLNAYMSITERTFKNITFKNQTIPYDGEYHSIYVEGAPDFATVTYRNNNQRELGTYNVTATISAVGYKTLTLSASMVIAKILPEAILENRTLIYNGMNQLISYSLPELTYGVKSYLEIEFYVDNKKVEENDFRVKTIGTHIAKVVLKCDKYNYQPSTASATIKVVGSVGTIDPSKNSFRITNSLKYQELRTAILNGNFTITEQVADEYFYPDGTTKYTESSIYKTYVTENEAFSIYDSREERDVGGYGIETTYNHYKIVGDEVLENEFNEGIIDSYSYYKIPASSYHENIIGKFGLKAISLLKESSDGGFENGQQGGYVTSFGTFSIDEDNNTFTLENRSHYYHSEFNHDEICYITISNIGNTKIVIDDYFDVANYEYDLYQEHKYSINGFDYYEGSLDVTFDSIDLAYNEKKEYIIPASINGTPITKFTEEYYHRYYNLDLTGYIFKCYTSYNGYYEGDYESYGHISNFSYLTRLTSSGATVLYYGEW